MRMKQPDEEFQVVRMFSSVKYFNRNENVEAHDFLLTCCVSATVGCDADYRV
jgi:hypothetical protein